jgi:hypothetical protein
MSAKANLILVGIVVVLLGFAQLASSPRGAPNRGFQISNIGINTGVTRPPGSQFGPRATGKNTSGPAFGRSARIGLASLLQRSVSSPLWWGLLRA